MDSLFWGVPLHGKQQKKDLKHDGFLYLAGLEKSSSLIVFPELLSTDSESERGEEGGKIELREENICEYRGYYTTKEKRGIVI